MKKAFPLLLLLFLGLLQPATHAQGVSTVLQSLRVEIWPDYDRPDALFLLTGAVPLGTPLPTTLTIPIPENAELNAVARITSEGQLIDDIPFSQNGGELTFTLPDFGFRVEYYLPFSTTEGTERAFRFAWLSPLEILQLVVDVQQPRAATSFVLTPPAVNVSVSENDGLTYHTLPVQVVPANQAIALDIAYETTGALTAVDQPLTLPTTPTSWLYFNGINIPFVLAGVGALFLIGYGLLNRNQRGAPKKRKPRAKKRAKSGAASSAKYCVDCGKPLKLEHKYCRHCGTAVKQ